MHLAAEIKRASGGVFFENQTVPPDEPEIWVFHLLDGSAADAAALAGSLNVKRRLAR